ncbi:hypothetical protein [Anabaena sp. CCY 0017]|uniref:hypothetical protein n=1 Tax=Anabaena sp. CCY 0017 TaxID=3103866 RepID=UPI0039C70034
MQPDHLDELLDTEDSEPNQDTARYLQYIENKLYEEIEARKRLDSGVLFLVCQLGSVSLSWFLFTLQVSISLIVATCIICALLPGLIDAGESFNFELSSERWEVRHSKPLVAISKLAIGGVISWHSTRKISSAVYQTHAAIKETYSEIKAAESLGSGVQIPGLELLIAGVVGVGLIAFSNIRNKGNSDV